VLLEREVEATVLAAAVAGAAAGRGTVVVIEGAAGLGKTRLLRHAAGLAAGARVLTASGSDLEHDFGFGVVRQLFERVAAESELEGAAALAAPALGHASDASGDRFASLHGLYWLVANLASAQPLLLIVDDAQWADVPSLRFLAYLARRVAELPVALLVAARPPLPDEDRTILEAIAAEAQTLAPAPLSESAIATLAGESADPAFVTAVHHATAGNALLVEELLAEARDLAYDMHPTRIPGSDPGIRVGYELDASVERIGRRVARRLAALGEAAAPLAGAVAVLGDGATLHEAAALAGVGDAAELASQLIGSDVLLDAPSPAFRHALVREAVLDGLTAPLRRAAHHRAAALLRDQGAPLERIAAQLLLGERSAEPWAVEVLRAAAAKALDPGVAADLLARALEEPPPAEQRAAILAELGEAELHAGRLDGCDRLREAIALQHDPRERARRGLTLGLELAGMQRERAAIDALAEALAAARGVDRELALGIEAHLAHAERYGGETGAVEQLGAGLTGATPAERFVLAMDATLRPASDAAEAAAFAARVEAAWNEDLMPLRAATGAVATYLYAGELERAKRFAEALLADARRRALVFAHARASSMVAMVALASGRVADAEAALVATVEIETYGVPRPAVAVLIEVLIELGRLDEAAAVLTRYAADGPLPAKMLHNPLLMARARLRAAQHRPADALDDALELGRRYAGWGLAGRPLPPWRGLAATLGGGDALVEEQLALARRWGGDHAIGVALRDAGIVRQDTEALAESARRLAGTPVRLDYASALVELGAALRRGRRRADALEPLNRGMDLAHRCGSAALAERARTELLACGSRPRGYARSGRDALTASELRVARMAADGMTNREIAQALFITIRTVTTHLGHAYEKLGISGREQLAAELAERS
jgi:DNA-binding CsgD family transcriptional regulator